MASWVGAVNKLVFIIISVVGTLWIRSHGNRSRDFGRGKSACVSVIISYDIISGNICVNSVAPNNGGIISVLIVVCHRALFAV